ncbi:transport and Golgi organization protein 1-like protein [Huso huso]|uniref:Transport and Golgi organization protein 1-like protein n=1 Tax=Huso huso TaxID=61971 RepID=A0ABR0Y053_HUSHU
MVTFLMGYISFLVVLWRTVLAVSKETEFMTVTQLHQKITQLSDEICQAAGHLSDLKHTIQEHGKHLKETEEATQSSTRENKNLQGMCEYLQRVNESAEEQLRASQSALEQHKTKRANQEQLISEIQTSIQSCEKIFESWNAEPLKEAGVLEKDSLEEAEFRAKLQWTLEENERLNHEKEEASRTLLLKEVKDGEKQRSKLTEEMKMLQKISKDMADSIACKDCDIEALYDQISKLGGLKADAQCETVTIQEGNVNENQMKKTIKQINIVSQIQLTAKAEERDRNLAKLADEEKARREMEEKRRNLEHRNLKTAQHKLEILRDLYEQTWNTLRQKLLQEEHRHGEKEERLFEGNGNPAQANKELKIYKERLQKIQETLKNTQYSYAYQNLSCEKAVHEKWLQKRAAERALQVQKDENANLPQKLVEAHIRLGNVQRASAIRLTPTHRVTQSLPQHSRACVQPLTASETPLDDPKNATAGIPSSSPGTLMAGSSCSASSKKRSAPDQ